MPIELPPSLEEFLQTTRSLRDALDLPSYLQLLTDLAAELTHSEGASILLPNEEKSALCFFTAPRLQREVLRGLDVPVDGSAAGRVFTSGQPEIVVRRKGETRFFTHVDQLTGVPTRNMVVVPLIFKGQTLGVIEVINRLDNDGYTEDDVALLEVLAAQAALLLYTNSIEKQLEAVRAETNRLERMKSNFIAITSHELRTPLGLILGHATFLRDMADPQYHEQLDTIIRSAMRLKNIIESLSSVDNFERGVSSLRSRMVSIKRLTKDLVNSFQSEAKQRAITLRAKLGNADLWVDGDPEKLELALGHVIKNALQFTEPGGMVVVSAESVPGYVKITVVDNGIGIPASDLTRIFERFYQVQSHLTRTHGGMGLGLSVAKAMVELHRGRIWAESVEGKGSTFTILLPLDASQSDAAQRVFTA